MLTIKKQHYWTEKIEKTKRTRRYLKEGCSVRDVVPHPPLSCDPNLILVYRSLRSWLLHSLVAIHLKSPPIIHQEQKLERNTETSMKELDLKRKMRGTQRKNPRNLRAREIEGKRRDLSREILQSDESEDEEREK